MHPIKIKKQRLDLQMKAAGIGNAGCVMHVPRAVPLQSRGAGKRGFPGQRHVVTQNTLLRLGVIFLEIISAMAHTCK